VYRNHLVILTQGEEDSSQGWQARVSNWFFSREG
jgi:hypothetical protein